MYKIIALVRVSSDVQDTASQRDALFKFITGLGFQPEQIKWHEIKASATKAKKDYTDFIEGIKRACLENDIKNIAVFHINRIGRREEYLFGFKRFCIEKQVQLFCMEPNFKLLDDTGEVNSTSDIIYNMYISFVQSETKERELKLRRGKQHNHITLNKYAGGRIAFGYSVTEAGDVVVNPEEAEVVQKIFDMYNSGKYSGTQICKELNVKGISRRGGKWFPASLNKMLSSSVYCGGQLKSGFVYPAIVTKDTIEKASAVKDKNRCGDKSKESKLCNLGTKIIRCTCCGRKYIGTNLHYQCIANHNAGYLMLDEKCKSPVVNIKMVDGILWHIARPLYVAVMAQKNEIDIQQLENEISEYQQMINGLTLKKDEVNKRRNSLEERYFTGKLEMSEERFNSLSQQNKNEIDKIDTEIDVFKSRIEILQSRIKVSKEPLLLVKNNKIERRLDGLDYTQMPDKEICRDIIRSVISAVYISKIEETGETLVKIELTDNRTVNVKYKFKSRIKHIGDTLCGHIQIINTDEWIEFIYERWNREKTGGGYDVVFRKNVPELILNLDYVEGMVDEFKKSGL